MFHRCLSGPLGTGHDFFHLFLILIFFHFKNWFTFWQFCTCLFLLFSPLALTLFLRFLLPGSLPLIIRSFCFCFVAHCVEPRPFVMWMELHIWSMGNSAVTLPLKTRTPHPSAAMNSQYLLGQCWGPLSPSFIHNWKLTGPVFCRPTATTVDLWMWQPYHVQKTTSHGACLYRPPLTFPLPPLLWCSLPWEKWCGCPF